MEDELQYVRIGTGRYSASLLFICAYGNSCPWVPGQLILQGLLYVVFLIVYCLPLSSTSGTSLTTGIQRLSAYKKPGLEYKTSNTGTFMSGIWKCNKGSGHRSHPRFDCRFLCQGILCVELSLHDGDVRFSARRKYPRLGFLYESTSQRLCIFHLSYLAATTSSVCVAAANV